MKRICFISNFSITYLYHAISQKLIKENIEIYWIVSNAKLYEFLKSNYTSERILFINKSWVNIPNKEISDFKINELLYGDRVLKHDFVSGEKFLIHIQKPVYEFLKNNDIKIVFGEQTWAHELLIGRICNYIGIEFLAPQVTRIPNQRFTFFKGESQNELFENSSVENPNVDIFKIEKPAYLIVNDRIAKEEISLKGRFKKIVRFIKNVINNEHKNDPTVLPAFFRFKIRIAEEWNKEIFRFIKTDSIETLENEKYVLLTLHVQPESSIDVMGRYYENQLLNIVNLWRKLPVGWKLVVKEHTNGIGNRNFHFYKYLGSLNNIVLINEKTNSQELILKSQLVIAVTGTIAYEAALLKKPSVIFAPVYFSRLNFCSVKSLHDIYCCDTLEDWINEIEFKEDNRREFCNYIIKNSYEGIYTDPTTSLSVINENNIMLLSLGFKSTIDLKYLELKSQT